MSKLLLVLVLLLLSLLFRPRVAVSSSIGGFNLDLTNRDA